MDFLSFNSIGSFLFDSIGKNADKSFLIEANKDLLTSSYTYSEAQKEVERFLAVLQINGFVNIGFKIAIILPNQSKWIISAISIFFGGGIIVPIDYKLSPKDQVFLIKHSESRFVITEKGIYENLMSAGIESDSLKFFITDLSIQNNNLVSWSASTDRRPIFYFDKNIKNDIATLIYSSGTSGDIKACQLSHGAYLFQMQSIFEKFSFNSQDVIFSILPTNHAIDFMSGFLMPINVGAKILHQRVMRPEYLLSSFKIAPVSYTVMVPILLEKIKLKIEQNINDKPIIEKLIFNFIGGLNLFLKNLNLDINVSKYIFKQIQFIFGKNLKMILVGGAPVDPELVKFYYKIGIKVIIGYGLTEACTVLALNSTKDFKFDSVGKVLKGVEIEIRDSDEKSVGTIWIKSPTVMSGYYKNKQLTDEVIVNGWLCTGDLGVLDKNQYLYVIGRKKNMVVTAGGKNVYPEEIEAKINHLHGVEEYVIFSNNFLFNLKSNNDFLVIVVYIRNGNLEHIMEEIIKKNRKLPPYKRIKKIYFYKSSFPKTASLKVKRQEIVNAFKFNVFESIELKIKHEE